MHKRKIFVLDDERRWTQKDINYYYASTQIYYGHHPEVSLNERDRQFLSILKQGLEVCVDVEYKKRLDRHLPEGYDGYWIHFSMTSPEAIKELRELQPWAPIVVSSMGFDYREIAARDLQDIADSLHIVHGNGTGDTWCFLKEVAIGDIQKQEKSKVKSRKRKKSSDSN